MKYYLLKHGVIVEEPDVQKWSRDINHDLIGLFFPQDGVSVATWFSGMDPDIHHSDKPRVFITQINGGVFNERTRLYHTREEAEEGHERICLALSAFYAGDVYSDSFRIDKLFDSK